MDTLLAMQFTLLATIGVGIAGALIAWRERPEPGSIPLTVLLVGQCWWSATLFFRINASGLGEKVLWVDVSWLGIAALPAAWLFFCLSYAGYSRYLQPRYVALVGLVPALTALFGVTNEFHHLMYTQSTLVVRNGTPLLVRTPGVWFWVVAGYTYLLGLLGAIPLLGFVTSDMKTFQGQSLALLVGLVVPWITNILFLMGALPTGGIDPTPVAFSLSAVAFLGALTRFQLLGTSPAPIRPARQSVFDQMEGGVIVLDRRNNIVDMNDRAVAAVADHPSDVLGGPVETVIPQFATLTGDRGDGQTVVHAGADGRTYDVSANQLTLAHGRKVGHIVTLHDISEYLRQQQRLEVLNRLFRHNIRTKTQVIISHVEYLADHDSAERAATAKANALEIEEFSDKIRSILDVFERGRNEAKPEPLDVMLRGCADAVRRNYPTATVHYDGSAAGLYVDSVVDDVLSNVVENAAEHNPDPDPTIHIEVTHDGDRVEVAVRDDGPGINDEELTLLTEGAETPLKHGSGLGLALVVWGTEIIGGSVTFGENDPTGTVVTVSVPVLAGPDAATTEG